MNATNLTDILAAHQRLCDKFAYELFSRREARRAGLEVDLWAVESAGMAKFVRCPGAAADGKGYCSDNEQFRLLFP
jgi:hypothetical protein